MNEAETTKITKYPTRQKIANEAILSSNINIT
jgi:hypothetical protein